MMKRALTIIVMLIVGSLSFGIKPVMAVDIPQFGTFARIKADNPPRSSLPGWKGLKNPPATMPIHQNKLGGGMENLSMTSGQFALFKALNPVYYRALAHPPTGYCNFNDPEWETKVPHRPKCLSMGFEWNVVRVNLSDIQRGGVRVECISNPNPDLTLTYKNTPWLIHQFTVITQKGNQIYPAGGKKFYTMMYCSGKFPMYIDAKMLEIFPTLPRDVVVTSPTGLNLRSCPDTTCPKITSIGYGKTLNGTSYLPQGDKVWMLVQYEQYGGWIAVQWVDNYGKPVYYTSWKMQTPPPLP